MERLVTAVSVMSVASLLTSTVHAQTATASYPSMAPIEQYRMTPAAEIALAKSAAPAAISGDADVLIFGSKGYESAVRGHSGFVCLVQRSWANDFDHPEFWNPKTRAPMCFNPAAARSVLPAYLSRTEWVLARLSRSAMQQRSRGLASGKGPEIGAMCYMLSKDGYLGDDVGGPWHPHLMFFLPRGASADWGANHAHSPVFLVDSGKVDGVVVFAVPVFRWSDGTQDSTSRE
jgi:hypothetical protein